MGSARMWCDIQNERAIKMTQGLVQLPGLIERRFGSGCDQPTAVQRAQMDKTMDGLKVIEKTINDLVGLLTGQEKADDAPSVIALSKLYGLPYASLKNKLLIPKKGQNLKTIITEEYARMHCVLPLFVDENIIGVAIASPDKSLVDELNRVTRMSVQPFLACKSQLLKAIDGFYARRG
jgi:hypothetical protein